MAVLNTGLAKTSAGGFTIPYSCRFDGSSAYLKRTPASASNQKTWTLSVWLKRGKLSSEQRIFGAYKSGVTEVASLDWSTEAPSNTLYWHLGGASNYRFYTSSTYRDPSAWYHLVFSCDTSSAGGRAVGDMQSIYVNGELVTAKGSTANPVADYEGLINIDEEHVIGANRLYANFLDGYMAEMHFIDGTALTPTSFGETGDYGEWKPIKVSGLTYGTNGFYLDFSDSAALGDDAAGSNDWTVVGLTAADQMLDTPTNSFATMNPLKVDTTLSPVTAFSEGNLKIVQEDGYYGASSTMGFSSGKWYAEFLILTSPNNHASVGITPTQDPPTDSWNNPPSGRDAYVYYGITGNAPQEADSYGGSAIVAGDLVGVAVDMDNTKIWFSKNGTWQASGDPAAGTNFATDSIAADTYEFILGDTGNAFDSDWIANFGQDSSFAGEKTAQGNQDGNSIGDFYYTPPSGFLALCTSNLPEPAVIPSEHFNNIIYTGNDGTQSITGVGFQPDLLWNKTHNVVNNHFLIDAVRGVTKLLFPNLTNAEATDDHDITAFTTDGFSLDGSGNGNVSGSEYMAWNWKANGAGSSNENGSINTTATSANTDAGFSISTYSGDGNAGATVGHGLSKAPEMVMIKRRDAIDNWPVHHGYNTTAPETERLYLDSNGATYDDDVQFNDTLPSATVVTIGDNDQVNNSSGTYVMYCWHSVDGYSKVGSYEGNGDADGTFVYTGFRPAFIIQKRTDSSGDWNIYDSKLAPYNEVGDYLHPHNSALAGTAAVDLLSNGFKFRDNTAIWNASGGDYVYIAFAETPFKYSNAR